MLAAVERLRSRHYGDPYRRAGVGQAPPELPSVPRSTPEQRAETESELVKLERDRAKWRRYWALREKRKNR